MSDDWIGVDLDSTLAYYEPGTWKGPKHIGAPIPLMVNRIKRWRAQGRTVKIFTARVCDPEAVPFIEAWCLEHVGEVLPVTNVKDYSMIALFDDRAFHIVPNTGRLGRGRVKDRGI